MHIGMIDLQMNMEGPIAEINISEIDVEWNGAIAFIDRDGVLNYGSPNYINNPDELMIIPGSKEAIMSLRSLGYRIALVTNQSAIMRGLLETFSHLPLNEVFFLTFKTPFLKISGIILFSNKICIAA